jgi:hypothetical protein
VVRTLDYIHSKFVSGLKTAYLLASRRFAKWRKRFSPSTTRDLVRCVLIAVKTRAKLADLRWEFFFTFPASAVEAGKVAA